tara:strand:- start:154 stop:795 length:642 start_codon:yes stop_codon:yes gene_type:complete
MKFLQANMLSFACLAIMLAAGLYLYPGLPETLPSQYGFDGVGRNHLPKIAVVLLWPLIYGASIIAINVMIHFSPDKFSMPNSKRAMDIIVFGAGLLMLAVHVGIMIGAGDTQTFQQYFSIGLALFLLITGNVFGKTERNFFIGIRLPWTIASIENWRATHRFAGRLMVGSGLLLLVTSYFQPSLIVTLILGFNWALLAVVYSFLFYLKNERTN